MCQFTRYIPHVARVCKVRGFMCKIKRAREDWNVVNLRRGVITCKGDRCRPGTVADAVENIRDGRCGVGFGSSVSVDSLVHKAIDCV